MITNDLHKWYIFMAISVYLEKAKAPKFEVDPYFPWCAMGIDHALKVIVARQMRYRLPSARRKFKVYHQSFGGILHM